MKKCNLRWFSPQKIKRQLAFVLAICLVCIVPVTTYAQILKISMKRTNVSIQNVIRELEQKSGYTFFYNDNQVKLTKKVSVDVTDAPIENVLDQIFNNSGYTYKIIDNQIVVSAIKAEIPENLFSSATEKCTYHRTSKRYHRRTYHWCFCGGKRVSK